MTTIAPTTAGAAAAELWHKVDRDFWVGNREGVFLGTIERSGPGRFVAYDSVRSEVGVFRSLGDARAAIAARSGSEG